MFSSLFFLFFLFCLIADHFLVSNGRRRNRGDRVDVYVVEYTYIFSFLFRLVCAERDQHVAYVKNNNTYIYFVVLIFFSSLYYHSYDPYSLIAVSNHRSSGIHRKILQSTLFQSIFLYCVYTLWSRFNSLWAGFLLQLREIRFLINLNIHSLMKNKLLENLFEYDVKYDIFIYDIVTIMMIYRLQYWTTKAFVDS